LTDEELIKGCIQEDESCQRELFRRYPGTMLGVCQRYARSAADAEDIVQDAFIKVFEKIYQFKSEGSFEGWIRRVFINSSIEHLRRKKMTLSNVSEKEENTIENADISALDNLAEKDIINLIQDLSPGYRTVFNLYVIEGYSHKEIAEALGISEGTSKSQYSRAKVHLQNMLKMEKIS